MTHIEVIKHAKIMKIDKHAYANDAEYGGDKTRKSNVN